jgi:hypothetical protein
MLSLLAFVFAVTWISVYLLDVDYLCCMNCMMLTQEVPCHRNILLCFVEYLCGCCVQANVKPPMAVTNAVSWRSEGIRHKKNEVFLDVVESVNLLVNSNGTVVLSEVGTCCKSPPATYQHLTGFV